MIAQVHKVIASKRRLTTLISIFTTDGVHVYFLVTPVQVKTNGIDNCVYSTAVVDVIVGV